MPPNMWWHQHFNTGTTPARYLAFKYEGVAIRNEQGVPKGPGSRPRIGGDQIDYADETTEVRSMFENAPCRERAELDDGAGIRGREAGPAAETPGEAALKDSAGRRARCMMGGDAPHAAQGNQ